MNMLLYVALIEIYEETPTSYNYVVEKVEESFNSLLR